MSLRHFGLPTLYCLRNDDNDGNKNVKQKLNKEMYNIKIYILVTYKYVATLSFIIKTPISIR